MAISTEVHDDLKTRWAALRAGNPHSYTRNDAKQLGVSEAELIATRIGAGVVRLKEDPKAILSRMPELGRVKTITRNDHMVLERKGSFPTPQFAGPVGLFVGDEVDLRIFWQEWGSAFAVEEGSGDATRQSLQFFDRYGDAIHKVYLTAESDRKAYEGLVSEFTAMEPSPLVVSPKPAARALPEMQVDVDAFRKGWLGLQDTHDFYLLLRDHRLSRTRALELAPEGMAVKVGGKTLREVLTIAASTTLPIMIFVGNKGILQVYTGPVVNVVDARGWLNVLDPELDLHVKEEAINESWVVTKPTRDGLVTSLECYDANGELLIQLFGKRKPGIPELPEWRKLMLDLSTATA
jgi:putative hemin transport protein